MDYLLIKQIAEQKGLTFKKLCEETGVTEAGLHQMIRNESMKIEILEKISYVLEVPIYFFFEEKPENSKTIYSGQFGEANFFQNNIGATVDLSKRIDKSSKSKIEEILAKLRETEVKIKIYEEKLKDSEYKLRFSETECSQLKEKNSYYWESIIANFDIVTELLILIAEEDKKMQTFINERSITRRFIAQINTLEKLSGNKVLFSEKFFKYFKNPFI